MHSEITPQHQWLQKLVGDWRSEMECRMGPDQPAMKSEGTETVRSVGGLWTLGEGRGDMPDGDSMTSFMTLGFDATTGRFVGTFIASPMAHLWIYNGALNAAKTKLTLDTEGPSFAGDGSMVKYQDSIEFVHDDHRILRSQMPGPDGAWVEFMTAHYYRTK